MIGLLGVLYPLAIQALRGPLWLACLLPWLLIAFLVDLLANLEVSLYLAELPRLTEPTVSHRLSRLRHDEGWRGATARAIIPVLDFFDPSGKHIK